MGTRRHCSHIYLFGHHKGTSKNTRNCQQLLPLGSLRDESCFLFLLHAHLGYFIFITYTLKRGKGEWLSLGRSSRGWRKAWLLSNLPRPSPPVKCLCVCVRMWFFSCGLTARHWSSYPWVICRSSRKIDCPSTSAAWRYRAKCLKVTSGSFWLCPSSQLSSLNLRIVYSFRALLPVQLLISEVGTEVRFIMLMDYLVPLFVRFASLMNVSYYVKGLMKQIGRYHL